jgi:hypothetical protein
VLSETEEIGEDNYRNVHQKIPVLVIDNVNRLPGPMLAQFPDFAKEAADRGIAKVVFVTTYRKL